MEVSIKKRSPPTSLSFKGQATKQATVKWSITSLRKSCMTADYVFGGWVLHISFCPQRAMLKRLGQVIDRDVFSVCNVNVKNKTIIPCIEDW